LINILTSLLSFSLVGSLIRSRKLVRAFTFFLWIQLVASLAYFIAFTIALFDKSFQDTLVQQCVAQVTVNHGNSTTNAAAPTQEEIEKGCGSVFGVSKVLFFVSYTLFFFLNICKFTLSSSRTPLLFL
jgi:hypothetical protein